MLLNFADSRIFRLKADATPRFIQRS